MDYQGLKHLISIISWKKHCAKSHYVPLTLKFNRLLYKWLGSTMIILIPNNKKKKRRHKLGALTKFYPFASVFQWYYCSEEILHHLGKTKECKCLDQLHTLTGSPDFWTTVPLSQSFLPHSIFRPGPPNDTTRSHLRSWCCTTGTHSFNVFFNPTASTQRLQQCPGSSGRKLLFDPWLRGFAGNSLRGENHRRSFDG